MGEKLYLLPDSLRRAVMNYLNSRPYGEVVEGIVGLQNLQEAILPAPSETTPNEPLVLPR